MKLPLLLGVLVSCLAALGLVQAEATIAKQAKSTVPAGPSAFFFLEGSDGYNVLVGTVGESVVLEAKRKRATAVYLVRGHVSSDRIEARFGSLGRIAVEFKPFGGEKRKSGPCRRPSLDFGIFHGRIEFRGEDGYTEVKESRTFGLVFDPKPRHCGRPSAARASALPEGPSLDTHFSAISRRKGSVTSFEFSRKRGNDWLSLVAASEERRDGMRIFRQTSTVVGGENAFAASGPGVRPQFAFIAAPKPFSGSAVFDAGAEADSQWTGTLAAWLPGTGKVSLAGPDFAVSFCRRAADEAGCNPEPPVRRPFLAQGSGSQSQAFGEARLSWSRYLRNSASSAGSTP